MSLRTILAVDTAKAAAAASRLSGRQGTSLPGKIAMSVDPELLTELAGQVRGTVFAVCGTNGKTTTNNILCSMLEQSGNKVVCNRLGANMPAGVAAAFTEAAGLGGALDADYACIEVDEASARHVFGCIRPGYLVLTNLFRDQLDRYGEIDTTIGLLKEAIGMVPEMKLIVNADDPLSVWLAQETGNPYVCYGIGEEVRSARSHEIREGRFCKRCGAPLQYEYYHYGQMGKYRCSACDFARPQARYEARGISTEGGVSFRVEDQQIEAGLQGLYSVYNLLAVWSALREEGSPLVCGGDMETGTRTDSRLFNETLRRYHAQFGRNETFRIDGHSVTLNLAKNPAGFNQNIEAMLEDPEPKRLVIVINDNDQDGRDISWLWDVDFDRISDESVRAVAVSGIRALDMCLRLKYVEIPSTPVDTPEEAIEEMLAAGEEKLYVLVNYTALFPVHRYLLERERRKD